MFFICTHLIEILIQYLNKCIWEKSKKKKNVANAEKETKTSVVYFYLFFVPAVTILYINVVEVDDTKGSVIIFNIYEKKRLKDTRFYFKNVIKLINKIDVKN